MTDLFTFENNGPELISTNYWESQACQKGYVYLTINAGCFRLLVPAGKGLSMDDMKTGQVVLVTRGPWPDFEKIDALELLFEDHTDNPFVLHIVSEQCDRMPMEADCDNQGDDPKWKFAVYTEKDGKVFEVPARYRIANKLPFMEKWL